MGDDGRDNGAKAPGWIGASFKISSLIMRHDLALNDREENDLW